MGQTSSDSGGSNVNPQIPGATPGGNNPPSITESGSSLVSKDMNSTVSVGFSDMVRDNLDRLSGGLGTTTTLVPSSQTENVWRWDVLHIAVVSAGSILLLLVVFALLIFLVYYKRVLKPRGATVSFSGVSPSYNRARSTIYNKFAAEEAARRISKSEEPVSKRTPSPQSAIEEIPMTLLKQMQNDHTIEYDDDRGNAMYHQQDQDTELDGVFLHQSTTQLENVESPQYNELPHHTMPRPASRQRHQFHTHSHQKYHHHPHHVGSDLNANITLPVQLSHYHEYGSRSRKVPTDHRIDRINKTRGRLLSEPLAPRMCSCYLHRPEPRTISGVRRPHRHDRSFRPKLPKFNLAGEHIPSSSSEPSLIYSGTRAPRNSLSREDLHHHHELYDENYNNNQDLFLNPRGPETRRTNSFAYRQGRNTPTPRLVVPTNTPNSNHSGAGSVSLYGATANLDSDFGASAGVSQCNVSSDTSMTVAIGTGCSVSVADNSYEWDGYDPAYINSQILGYLDGAYFPILHTRQYWV